MKRTIVAILAADVAGYSRLVAEDEDDTLRRLAEYSAVFTEEVARFGGRVFNTAGDAILAEFPSAVEALRAAIAIQERLRVLNAPYPASRRVQFRMGLTIGDVVQKESGDLLGDAVNVAARLEGIAEPGGICISRSIHEAIAARLSVAFKDIGPQRLKNLPRPVHAFRVILPSLRQPGDAAGGALRRLLVRGAAMLVAALALAGGGAAVWYAATRAPEAPVAEEEVAKVESAPERTDRLAASVAHPRRMCFEDQVWLSGTLVPRKEVDVGPDAEGLRIVRVLANPADTVAAGQVLAELARPDRPDTPVAQVRAPVSGLIGRSTAQVGAITAFKAPPLFQIVANGDLELAAETPIRTLGKLALGQPAVVTPLGLSEVSGRVRSVSGAVDGGTQLGRARIALRTNAKLSPGAFARGIVKVGQSCGLSVPMSALAKSAEGTVVYVSSDGRIEGRLVETGLSAGNDVEIRSGLSDGDSVVTRAGPFVREGDAIRPITAAGPT